MPLYRTPESSGTFSNRRAPYTTASLFTPTGSRRWATKTRDVLDAADKWLSALNAVTAADEEQRRGGPEEATLDAAEVELAAAIMD